MIESLIQKLLNDKEKGLDITFKTDNNNYFVYIANGLHATMNEKTFKTFFEKWKTANTLLYSNLIGGKVK